MLSCYKHRDNASVNGRRRSAAVETSNIVKLNLPESNISEIKEFSDSLFKSNWEASIVFKTIQNGNSGVAPPVQRSIYTSVPRNLIHAKETPHPQNLRKRIVTFSRLYRGPGQYDNATDEGVKSDIASLRGIILNIGKAYITAYMTVQLAALFPHVKLANGSPIATFDDVCTYVRTTRLSQEMRELVGFVVHHLWGPSNSCLLKIESHVMDMLEIQYSNEIIDDRLIVLGTVLPPLKRKKIHDGGFVKKVLVRKKEELSKSVANTYLKVYHEILYMRVPKTWKARPEVLFVVRSTQGPQLFIGAIGICGGHPDADVEPSDTNLIWKRVTHTFATVLPVSPAMAAAISETMPSSPTNSMMDCLDRMEEKPVTPEELKAYAEAWEEKGPPTLKKRATFPVRQGNTNADLVEQLPGLLIHGGMVSTQQFAQNLLMPQLRVQRDKFSYYGHVESYEMTRNIALAKLKEARDADDEEINKIFLNHHEHQLEDDSPYKNLTSTSEEAEMPVPRAGETPPPKALLPALLDVATPPSKQKVPPMAGLNAAPPPGVAAKPAAQKAPPAGRPTEATAAITEPEEGLEYALPEVCDKNHEDIANFQEYGKGYFSVKQRAKHPEWPENCSRCQKSFWTHPDLLLKGKNANRMCPGLGGACIYCFCVGCFAHKLQKANYEAIAPPTPNTGDIYCQPVRNNQTATGRSSAKRVIRLTEKALAMDQSA